MPQKDKAKLGSVRREAGVPEHRAGYARKKDVDRTGPIKAPKSARAAAGQNQAFKANLGTMVRNVEMIMAGKLVNEGRILRMPSLKKLADEQLDMVRRAKEDGGSRVKAALERKNVKGLRGTLDLEEMAQLVPSLRKHLVAERSTEARRVALQPAEPEAGGGGGEDDDAVVPPAHVPIGRKRARAMGGVIDRAIEGAAQGDGPAGEAEPVDHPHEADDSHVPRPKRAREEGRDADIATGAVATGGAAQRDRAKRAGGPRRSKPLPEGEALLQPLFGGGLEL